MADPFDIAGSDQPAPDGGTSPDFWRNLMAFGAGMSQAANARTPGGFLAYGTGFGGPLGAGLQSGMQQSAETGKLRGGLGFQQAQTQQTRAATQSQLLQNQFLAQKIHMMNDPSFLSGGMGFGAAGTPAAAAPSGGTVPPSQRAPMLEEAVRGTPVPVPLMDALVQHESQWNPDATGSSGDIGLGQILPTTAQSPGFGMGAVDAQHITGAPNAPNNLKFAANYLYARGKAAGMSDADWQDPNKWATALAAYHSSVDNPRYVNQVMAGAARGPSWGMPAQAGVAPAAAPDPQALALAQQSMVQAQRLRFLGIDATPIEQNAQRYFDLAFAGPKAAAVAQAGVPSTLAAKGWLQGPDGSLIPAPGGPNDPNYVGVLKAQNPVDLRQGGMHWDAQKGWVKNPQLHEITLPDGSKAPVWLSPPMPGEAPGSGGETSSVMTASGAPAVSELPPQIVDARKKSVDDFIGKESDSYEASQNAQSWLTQMNHAADVMNSDGGWMGTGPTSPERLALASKVNDLFRTVGIKEPFDPTTVSSWEEFKKATITAGFELSSHYEGHSRQAAQTIMNATSAVPSPENSPIGQKLVSAGIMEAAQANIDLHEYKQTILNKTGDLTSADTAFFKQNPAQMYARRAISTVHPYTVKDPKEFNAFLPGTYVTLPDGRLTQVPMRPGAPPIPAYMRFQQQTAAAQVQASASPQVPH